MLFEDETIPRSLFWRMRGQDAFRDGSWKYLSMPKEGEMLFDLSKDPYEKTNLAARRPEKLAELKATVTDVKTRGRTPLSEAVRGQLKPAGKRQLVLAVWAAGSSLKHTLLERIGESP
ncbi:MAG: hypothetical protein IH945_09170 [Armatimonadetes bacterium]|nr:hypothetical protein [Armatimonadota bacterium]